MSKTIDVDIPHDAAERVRRQYGSSWRPIDSAPKDGTHILIARGPYYEHWGFPQRPPTVGHYFDGGWHLSVNHDGDRSEIIGATDWQPLPAPPAR